MTAAVQARASSPSVTTVLALHSLGLDGRSLDALRAALGSSCRLVSFDQRGHGAAADRPCDDLDRYVDDALQALDALGNGPVHLLGHSMGGAVAALAASRARAGQVASLSLLATPSAGMPAFVERGAAAMRDGMAAVIPVTLARWFGAEGAKRATPEVDYARRCLEAMSPNGFAGAWTALSQFGGYPALVDFLPPTLTVAVEDDLSTPPRVMQGIVDAFVAASRADRLTSATLASGGHLALLDASPALVEALTAHWRRHAAAETSHTLEIR